MIIAANYSHSISTSIPPRWALRWRSSILASATTPRLINTVKLFDARPTDRSAANWLRVAPSRASAAAYGVTRAT